MEPQKYSTNYTELMNSILKMSDDQQKKLLDMVKNISEDHSNSNLGFIKNIPSVFAVGIFMGTVLMATFFVFFTTL
jgi:hypothetical protein